MTTIQKLQFLQSKAIKLLATALLLVVLIGGGGYIYLQVASQNRAGTTNDASLQTAKATLGNLVLSANGTGKVMPGAESSFGFNTSGQISEIYVKIGDQVQAGQVLAQLDDAEAKVNLAEAQEAMNKLTSAAAIATARQTLAEAQTNLATTKASLEYLISPEVLYWEEKITEREQILKAAQTAYQTDTSEAAKQKVTAAEKSLKYAQDSLTYLQKVYKKTYVPT
ncbi:MAG TPA: biotin/lipoyl-binding protein, partial [Anaerolineales bacterium]|nr:biotin/lipoyl-binding protein [Anaerolineales bacterium]